MTLPRISPPGRARAGRCRPIARGALACGLILTLAACAVGPDYQRPSTPLPARFKEGGASWQRVVPGIAIPDQAAWWRALGDKELDALVQQAQQANQAIAQAEAAYRQAQAGVQSAAAAARPTLGVGVSGSRGSNQVSRELRQSLGQEATDSRGSQVSQSVQVQASASWEPDLWGRVRREVESQQASSEAAAADLAGERLSITGAVISDYLSLRQLDGDLALLGKQRVLYARLLQITEASQRQGLASSDDLLNARNNLAAATVSLGDSRIARARYEHAIAVLCGRAPADFAIAPRADYRFVRLDVPPSVPSTLLRRRPDIVMAERQVATANAQIGVAEAAFFPTLDLSASGGYSNSSVSDLFSVPNQIWSLGPELAETLFDGGARRAAKAQARAGYDSAVAHYRQTVLAAFQDVEDGLATLRERARQADDQRQVLERQQTLLAHRRQQQALGSASREDVLTDTLSAVTAQRNATDADAARSLAAVSLRLAVGGSVTVPAASVQVSRSTPRPGS